MLTEIDGRHLLFSNRALRAGPKPFKGHLNFYQGSERLLHHPFTPTPSKFKFRGIDFILNISYTPPDSREPLHTVRASLVQCEAAGSRERFNYLFSCKSLLTERELYDKYRIADLYLSISLSFE